MNPNPLLIFTRPNPPAPWRRAVRGLLLGGIVAAALLLFLAPPSGAQVKVAQAGVPVKTVVAPDKTAEDLGTKGAYLDTDPDVDSHLRKVREYIQDEKYREACMILQHEIDKSGSLMTSADGRLYTPVREEIEKILAALPPAGREQYRLNADGEAAALLAGAEGAREEAALAEVVRRYFISSSGDAAAYRLGALLLDRFDFSGARALFRKMLLHPDPTVPRASVLLRLVLAASKAHDPDGAKAALAQLAQLPSPEVTPALLEQLQKEIDAGNSAAVRPDDAAAGWPMALGRPGRDGVLPDLPAALGQPGIRLTVVWRDAYEFLVPGAPSGNRSTDQFGNPIRQNRQSTLNRWEKGNWMPVGQFLLTNQDIVEGGRDGGERISHSQVYFKYHKTLVCRDADSGRMRWKAEDKTAPSDFINQGFWGQNQLDRPTTPEEVMIFGDRVAKSMAIVDGVIYNIEGHTGVLPNPWGWNGQPRRSYANVLTGYQTVSGKLKWRIRPDQLDLPSGLGGPAPADQPPAGGPMGGAGGPAGGSSGTAQFLAAPIPCGGALIVPVEQGESQSIVALDPQRTETDKPVVLWRTFLCAGPMGGAARWSPIAVASEGGEVFVAGGRGVVFALDGADGAVRWAARYTREQPVQNMGWGAGVNGQRFMDATGWDEDTLIVRGSLLLVMPSDAKRIMALDRASGAEKFHIDKAPELRYCLGVAGDGLYLAGPQAVYKYYLPSAKLAWKKDGLRATGRGVVTPEAVYVPTRDSILRFDDAGGKITAKLPAVADGGEPVGSLFTDGQRFFAAGLACYYALMDSGQRLAVLTVRVGRGDLEARIERANLLLQLAQADKAKLNVADMEKAIEDLRLAVAGLKDDNSREPARRGLLDGLLALSVADPARAAALLDEAGKLASRPDEQVRVSLARASSLASLNQIAPAVDLYLKAALDTSAALIDQGTAEPGLQVQASRLAALNLVELGKAQPQAFNAVMEGKSGPALKAAQASGRVADLLAVARAFAGTRAGIKALVEGARLAYAGEPNEATKTRHVEWALALLRDMTRSDDKPTAAAGLAALASLHQDLGWTRQAAAEWKQLAADYAGVAVPTSGGGGGQANAADVAAAALAALGPDAAKPDPALLHLGDPPYKQVWSLAGAQYAVLGTAGPDRSQFLHDHVLLLNMSADEIICRSLFDSGSPTWKFRLPTVPQGVNYGQNLVDGVLYGHKGVFFPGGNLTRDGDVAVIQAGGDLAAYGLVSAKNLWKAGGATPMAANDPAIYGNWGINPFGGAGGSLPKVSTGGGVVAYLTVDDQKTTDAVCVLESATGAVLWKRTFDRQGVDGVAVAGGWVNVVSGGGKDVTVFDRLTGRKVNQFTLDKRQPNTGALWTDRGVVYQVENTVNLSLQPYESDKKGWTSTGVAVGQRVMAVGDRGVALIDNTQQKLFYLDLATGKTQWAIDAAGRNFQDLAAGDDGEQICATGYSNRNEITLTVVNTRTGKLRGRVILGQRTNFGVPAAVMAEVGDYAVGLQQLPSADPRRGGWSNQANFYRLSDGKLANDVKLPGKNGDGRYAMLTQPARIEGGVLVLIGQEGVMAFAPERLATPKPAPPVKAPDPAPATPQAGAPGL